jgi:hypothetical protein
MQFKAVKRLLCPLIKGGHDWQFISLNGDRKPPKLYFSNIQWFLLLLSVLSLLKLKYGLSKDIIGYVISAFSISVSLFMSLLVSIFDKFEKTDFATYQKTEEEITRLKQKKNFFKRFISITSYLVVLSILVIVLCSLAYIFNLFTKEISITSLTSELSKVSIIVMLKYLLLLLYRIILNYFLLNYLFLTLFVASSAYEYYISELDRRIIE